jgi:hypothetical protein
VLDKLPMRLDDHLTSADLILQLLTCRSIRTISVLRFYQRMRGLLTTDGPGIAGACIFEVFHPFLLTPLAIINMAFDNLGMTWSIPSS